MGLKYEDTQSSDLKSDPVKIRPKWDWNKSINMGDNKVVVLKSDQNGIEIDVYTVIWASEEFSG